MAALDFPNAPTLNQTFTGPNGVVWAWDGGKWINGTAVGTAYAPIASPVFTGDPQAPQPPVGDHDASIATTAFVQAAVAPAMDNVGRNLLHNPLFNVQQRGAGPFTANGYTADRWALAYTLDTANVAPQVMGDAQRSTIGDEAAGFYLANTFAGNPGAASVTVIYQCIEGLRRLSGKTVTVSFWAQASAALKLGVSFDQNFGSGGSPSTAVQGNGQAVTLTTNFARYSLTFTLPSATGKILGSNGDNSTVMYFWYSSGTTNATRSGNIGVQSGTINLWGVQLEVGSVATPLEKPDPRYDLSNCQRFYQVYRSIVNYQYAVAGSGLSSGFATTVTMRSAPTMAFANISYFNSSGLAYIAYSPSYIGWQWTVTATGTSSPTFDMTLSADL